MVGQRHSAAQSQGEGDVAALLHASDRASQRVHDDVPGVAEDRDGDEGADCAHRPGFTALAEGTQEGSGQGVGGAGDLEDLADADTESDDDADAGKGVAEARGYGVDDREQVLTGDDAGDDGCQEKSDEGVESGREHDDDDRRDSGDQRQDELQVHKVLRSEAGSGSQGVWFSLTSR